MHFRKSHVHTTKFDLQEANVSVSQFYRIRYHFVGCWTDGLLALDLWDVVIVVLRSSNSTKTPTNPSKGTASPTQQTAGNCSRSDTSKRKQKGIRDVDQLSLVDYVTTNANSFQRKAQLYTFEDNEAVIKMIIKVRCPTKRHVSRTHRVALDWLFDRINLDPKIQIKYVDTKNQLADMLTKGSFTLDEKGPPPSFVEYREFVDVFLQAISFSQTQSTEPCQRELKKVLPKKVRQWRSRDQ